MIEVSNEKERKTLPTTKSLCSSQFQEKVEVEIFACDKINQSKGLIYIRNYNIPDIDDYGSEPMEECKILYVQKATWMKTKNTTSTMMEGLPVPECELCHQPKYNERKPR